MSKKSAAFPAPGGLGRIPSVPDPANTGFRINRMLGARPEPEKPIPMRKTLRLSWQGDQGQTSQCVGFSTYAMLKATPSVVVRGKTGLTPPAIYQGSQQYDEWPGEGYDGTSVHGVMKFLKDYSPAKDIVAYYWAKQYSELLRWMGQPGGTPVVIGVNWYEKMNRTDKEGFIHPSGVIIGGHAIVIVGYNHMKGAFLLQNSWGKGWGLGGRCWLGFNNLQRLLEEDGEAAIATKFRVVEQ